MFDKSKPEKCRFLSFGNCLYLEINLIILKRLFYNFKILRFLD